MSGEYNRLVLWRWRPRAHRQLPQLTHQNYPDSLFVQKERIMKMKLSLNSSFCLIKYYLLKINYMIFLCVGTNKIFKRESSNILISLSINYCLAPYNTNTSGEVDIFESFWWWFGPRDVLAGCQHVLILNWCWRLLIFSVWELQENVLEKICLFRFRDSWTIGQSPSSDFVNRNFEPKLDFWPSSGPGILF